MSGWHKVEIHRVDEDVEYYTFDGVWHSEYVARFKNGRLRVRQFYCRGQNITKEVKAKFGTGEYSDKDKFAIMMQWGIKCLS